MHRVKGENTALGYERCLGTELKKSTNKGFEILDEPMRGAV